MTTISLRLPDDLAERLEQEINLSQQSRSDLIRAALEYFLRERYRQRLLDAFAAEATALDREELTSLAMEFAEAEEQALQRAGQLQ